MQRLRQSPNQPDFVQNPYDFYDRARAAGPFFLWEDYDTICATSHAAVNAILRDRRFGRETPPGQRMPVPDHLRPFYAVEDHSMLELEPPRHTRLRGLVLRAFTSRRIAALGPEIESLTHSLIDALPDGEFDLIETFAQHLPVIIIARLLGVPETMADRLLGWSHAMVRMYIPQRSRADEEAAARAAAEFSAFLRDHIEMRRKHPADDLLTHLIAARENEDRLATDEMIATCILLLNAGHEATVHTIGNGVKATLSEGCNPAAHSPAALAEEVLRHDPPLHLFFRHVYEPVEVMGQNLAAGSRIALLLGAANRDPAVWQDPHRFNPARTAAPHLAFGGGLHFCVGAPLARLELQIALPILFARLPGLALAGPATYADSYHFHGLTALPLIAKG
ncbi:cytochrome P450 [Szabonella alba]|uniref:Cytochrome P450 n=1 Tax=Szabonella alba TaxID=2804194 RepID=A0A8K0VAE6_9RHOB|nr:cytochrome P450 [Szabonella alba]MBL4918293.1 cytochrome P450 [Szabonella alba]